LDILELAGKDGSGDVHHAKAVADKKAITALESDEATSVAQSDKSAVSSSSSDKATTSENNELTPNRSVLSAPQLLPLLEQVKH
jgi:hypothetical protein